MKAVILLALLATLAFADYTPQWSTCSASDDPWQPTTITLEKEPKLNEEDAMHACGKVTDHTKVGSFKLQVKAGSVVIYTTTVALTPQEVFPGSQYCFDYGVYIPAIAKGTFLLTFNLQDDHKQSIGCFTINLTLKGSGNELM